MEGDYKFGSSIGSEGYILDGRRRTWRGVRGRDQWKAKYEIDRGVGNKFAIQTTFDTPFGTGPGQNGVEIEVKFR